MDLAFAAATDVGKHRDHNEDNFLIDKKLRLFVVADGMGGHAAGEVASSIAVHEIRDTVNENRDLIERFRVDEPEVDSVQILQGPIAQRRGYATLHLGLAGGARAHRREGPVHAHGEEQIVGTP